MENQNINEKLIELIKQNGNISCFNIGGVQTKSIFNTKNENAPTFTESIENFIIKSRVDKTNI